MKSFLIAIILAILMVITIVLNALYINNVGDRTECAIMSLPAPSDPSCISATEELQKSWKHYASRVHISVNHTVVDRIEEHLDTLAACAACGDVYGFYTARALALDALGDMRRLESIGAVL